MSGSRRHCIRYGTHDVGTLRSFIRYICACLAILLALLCNACTFRYIDADGNRHMIGLMDITIHPPAMPQTFAGNVVDVTTIGLTASQTAQGGYIALGYSRESTAELRDNALVVGNPLDPLARVSQPARGNP